MRTMVVAIVLLVFPHGVSGQDRFSVEVAAGSTLRGGGSVVSAALGYWPAARLALLVNVERTHLPFEGDLSPRGASRTRGGTMTFVSGELRIALLPADRLSPFVLAGAGGGVSRPNVNAAFPDPVSHDLRVFYLGGGVRVPLSRVFTISADARAMLALEGNDGVLAVWPVRAGIGWRF